jgi:hypothetical protein
MKPLIVVMYALLVGAAYSRSRAPDKFLTAAIVSMWIMALLAIMFFLNSGLKFGQLASEYARAFFSPLGMHANDLGRLYATAFGIVLFAWDTTKKPLLKTMLFFTIGIVCVALFLTFSRAAIISLVIIGVIYLMSRRNLKTLFLAVVGIPLALLLMPGAIWYRLGMGVEDGATGMSAGRVSDIWEPLIPQLFDKPFFGHGLQSVLWAPAMRMGDMFAVTHPHSAYLGALIDFGVVGALSSSLSGSRSGRGCGASRRTRSWHPTSAASSKVPPRRSSHSWPRALWDRASRRCPSRHSCGSRSE